MADRSPARFLAPLALIAALVAIALVVQLSRSDTSTSAVSTTRPARHARPAKPRPRTYIVKPGDTLTAIATKTGVSLDRLQQLNPGIDPQALYAGQRLKLIQ